MKEPVTPTEQSLEEERYQLLWQLQEWLEMPMLALAFLWLALFVVELVWGLTPLLEVAGYVIWGIFGLEFILGFTVAPQKLGYLRANWLKVIALAAPALRVFRVLSVFRAARVGRLAAATRGVRLVRVVSSLHRGMRAFGATMSRRGFGYVAGLTLLVTVVGAAGMYAFEGDGPNPTGLHSYGTALWWTAMIMTTLGSEYWPQTPEGRVLCFLLSVYAFAVFGYATATLASFFLGQDAANTQAGVAATGQIALLQAEVATLREELRRSSPSEGS